MLACPRLQGSRAMRTRPPGELVRVDAGRAMRVGRILAERSQRIKSIDDRRSRGGTGRLKVFTSTGG
jgi:hypothetical protein